MFVSYTRYMQWKINIFTSFAIDNIYHVNFKNKKVYFGVVKFKNKILEVLENTFNLHSNST